MIDRLRSFFTKHPLRKLIEIAIETLYSERFDFDSLVTRLSQDGQRQGKALLRAYVAIEIAARLKQPLTDDDVDGGINVVTASEAHADSQFFLEVLDIHGKIAEHFWSYAHFSILRGKFAHENDEHSFDGAIYDLQRSKKGPASIAERNHLKLICNKMANLNRQIEQAELEAWKEQDEKEYHRYKEELEIRNLRAEIESHKDDELALNSAEVYSMLRARLESMLCLKK
jgi:hypothetical protein